MDNFDPQAAKDDVMVSLHLKATMMKVSDPVLFGTVVRTYFADAFEKHASALESVGANADNGLGAVLDAIKNLHDADRAEVEASIAATYASSNRPRVAMVDSDKGITNFHVPSDVIIDASMPAMIRDGGRMWNADGELEDVVCVIPDRSYAAVFAACVDDCKKRGKFDVSTMGSVSNVGLMARKAEEYGSHDKTFVIERDGVVKVFNGDDDDDVVFEHAVSEGYLWRMCQTKDEPIRDWVKLAVNRARATGAPAVFWLDPNRAHDVALTSKVRLYLADHDVADADVSIKSPVDAIDFSMTRARAGQDTISVTGNVLRDYLTDLFPIIELGTSAKMLSIVPLLRGGGLFETGAGGSAPKHVQQFTEENHLRWDSLGEYLALAVSLEDLAHKTRNPKIKTLAKGLTTATGKLLDENKSPGRKVGEPDNRAAHFYVAMWWAEAVSRALPSFKQLASDLAASEDVIVRELTECQGSSVDVGGYWLPDVDEAERAMRPSETFNALVDQERSIHWSPYDRVRVVNADP